MFYSNDVEFVIRSAGPDRQPIAAMRGADLIAVAGAPAPAISAAGAQSIRRLKSRLGAAYGDLMRGPDPVSEGDHYPKFEEPARPQ